MSVVIHLNLPKWRFDHLAWAFARYKFDERPTYSYIILYRHRRDHRENMRCHLSTWPDSDTQVI